jgi:TolB-like protein
MPAALGQILGKALEKDRNLRYQTATDLKTDLLRLKRDLDSGQRTRSELPTRRGSESPAERSIAVLYFENLSGAKDDEYFRDGITEDIITELSKIKGLKMLSRHGAAVPRQAGQPRRRSASSSRRGCVLAGSLRRGGNRLRISAQLVDVETDSLLWSERYDREMADVSRCRTRSRARSPKRCASALAAGAGGDRRQADGRPAGVRPLSAGKSYARRLTRQDLEFALQMYENAVAQDPNFAPPTPRLPTFARSTTCTTARPESGSAARAQRRREAIALQPDLPEAQVAQAWILYAMGDRTTR